VEGRNRPPYLRLPGLPRAALDSPLRRGLRPCVRGVLRNVSLTPRHLRHARTGGDRSNRGSRVL